MELDVAYFCIDKLVFLSYFVFILSFVDMLARIFEVGYFYVGPTFSYDSFMSALTVVLSKLAISKFHPNVFYNSLDLMCVCHRLNQPTSIARS